MMFICRWPNGDVSFVEATDEADAIEILDEVGEATPAYLAEVKKDFLLNLRLKQLPGATDPLDHFELEGFGEEMGPQIEEVYPLLFAQYGDKEPSDEDVATAIEAEKTRVQ